MNIKLLTPKTTLLILLTFAGLVYYGCSSDKSKSSKSQISDDLITGPDEELLGKIDAAKKIFYSLPSPLETAVLIKNAGATYDAGLLNPVSNTSNYNTNLEMALNLGIYSTNLSYASLFEQTQATLDYINAAKKMADGLSILDAIDEQTIKRLEENINNKDVIVDIISETLLNSNSFLEDRGLQATASVILVGGWVEGLYIATNLVPANANLKTDKLVERIIDQKMTLDIVMSLLENNKEDIDVQVVMKDVEELKAIYDKIKISHSEIEAVEDPNSNVTVLKSETSVKMSSDIFEELSNKVKEIRTRYIS